MTVTLRPATPADLPALSAMARESFTETFAHLYKPADLAHFNDTCLSPEAFGEELADGQHRIMLALDGDRIAGFAKLGPPTLPVAEPGAQLNQLYVLSPWHGTGIAQRLMAWALETARAEGHRTLHLSVYTDNERGKRFYRRYGGEDVGRYDFPVGDQIDEDRLYRFRL